MKAPAISFLEWQQRFANEEACLEYLVQLRWPQGFRCPKCAHDHGYRLSHRRLYECAGCHRQTSVTAGTLFHSTNLPLTKWFWAIYWVSSDKGGISALRLSKLIGVTWRTAYAMLRKLRQAMGHRDSLYRLGTIIELDDALIGGKRPGKRGRGAQGKTALLIACEQRGAHAGFVAMQAVEAVTHTSVRAFAQRHLQANPEVHTDALPALNCLSESARHVARVTPAAQASTWLPWVHIVISHLKRALLGTFHGVSPKYLQDYLNEFCYRFNRRFWEHELPSRLLRLCVEHAPASFA
jgi:transposase-like protein